MTQTGCNGRQRGFTAIELAAVIAITGIVTALAYSAYRTYTVRAEVARGIEYAHGLTDPIVETFRRHGEAPARVGVDTLSRHGNGSEYVASIAVENGRIDIVYGNRADAAIADRRLSLTPYETAGLQVVWVCGNRIPGPGLQPLGFAGGGLQTVQIATTVEARYLPRACR